MYDRLLAERNGKRNTPSLPVQGVSMQPGNRVVLTCVGGKDSYAVFEAAKDDTAAVLFVGKLLR